VDAAVEKTCRGAADMNTKRFKRQLLSIEILSWIQRSLRMSVRSAWLGLGAYLVAYSANSLLGWLPDPKAWIQIAIAVFCLFLLGVFLPLPRSRQYVWKLDRRLGGMEQVSTAWAVAGNGQTGHMEETLIKEALIEDALKLLPGFRKRVLLKGWHLLPDLVSLLAVSCLLIPIFTTQPVDYQLNREVGVLALPPSIEEPTYREVFPTGSPGLQKISDRAKEGEEPVESSESASNDEIQLTPEGYQKVADALQELGDDLSKNAATYDVGEALMRMEIEQAASAMESLAAMAAQLAPETRNDLAQSLQDTAINLPDIQSIELIPHLMDAARTLVNQDGSVEDASLRNNLENVAGDLRQVGDLLDAQLQQPGGQPGGGVSDSGAGEGAGKGAGLSAAIQRGIPEPFTRLLGEGQTIELESLSNSSQSSLRSANPPSEPSSASSSGPRSSVDGGSSSVIEADLVPFRYPWKWRDVVSKYFSP
jgi:hypothetical protein